jgi:hypothetical protein
MPAAAACLTDVGSRAQVQGLGVRGHVQTVGSPFNPQSSRGVALTCLLVIVRINTVTVTMTVTTASGRDRERDLKDQMA